MTKSRDQAVKMVRRIVRRTATTIPTVKTRKMMTTLNTVDRRKNLFLRFRSRK